MTPAEEQFVAEMGQFLGASGMTPMGGRMWGWLLICDPPEQTADDLATALRASRGAISGTARMLETAGMIKRLTRPGDRRRTLPCAVTVAIVRNPRRGTAAGAGQHEDAPMIREPAAQSRSRIGNRVCDAHIHAAMLTPSVSASRARSA